MQYAQIELIVDLSTGEKFLHSCMAIIFMFVKITFLLFCHNTHSRVKPGKNDMVIIRANGITLTVSGNKLSHEHKCKKDHLKSVVDKYEQIKTSVILR